MIRPPSPQKSPGTSTYEHFKDLRSGPGSGSAPGASHPGGEAEGEGAWPLSRLIETLPLDQNSEGILPSLHRRLASTGRLDDTDLSRTESAEGEEDDDQGENVAEDEDPSTIEYTPGCQIRYVWLGVERYILREQPHVGDLPKILDKSSIKVPAFLCIISHLRAAVKNSVAVLERPKSLDKLVEDAKGRVATAGGPLLASFPGYQKIRLPPYDFHRMYGDPTDPPDARHWLQINASLAKPSQKSLCRFLLEINC